MTPSHRPRGSTRICISIRASVFFLVQTLGVAPSASSGDSPVRGDVLPSVRDSGFSSSSGVVANRRRAELMREARELRRQAVEEGLGKGIEKCVKLGLHLVEDALAERELALELGRAPDEKVMSRGQKAADQILDRLVPKTTKIEGDVVHTHLFDLLAERVRLSREAGNA